MDRYIENEIKVLNVDVEALKRRLIEKGAELVFSGERVVSTFDEKNEKYRKTDTLIRLTEEKSIKLTIHINNTSPGRQVIKLHVSDDKSTTEDFLTALDLQKRTQLVSHRTSFELEDVDFDIDQFPFIPPFLEIDLNNLKCSLETLLLSLDLNNNQIVTCGTESIFELYGFDYYSLFAL